jgi:hypothetical protein
MKAVISMIFAFLMAFSVMAFSHDGNKKKHKKKACCAQMQAQGGCSRDANGNLPACCTKNKGKHCSKDCPHSASVQPTQTKPGCNHHHQEGQPHQHPHN